MVYLQYMALVVKISRRQSVLWILPEEYVVGEGEVKNMRVLILYANTGRGYDSAARAIAEQMEKLGMDYEIVDALHFISDTASDFVSRWRTKIYKHFPRMFGMIYRYEEKHPPRFIYERCARGADALAKKLEEGKYEAIVCVQLFAGMMLTEARLRYNITTPSYFVAPDYTCSAGISELRLDRYFVPHRLLFASFIRSMIPADKMVATGIPVRSLFYEEMEKAEARRMLGLPEEGKMVLVGCGSMGYGHLERGSLMLRKKLPSDSYLVVLCGKNEKAYETLKPYESDRFFVIGFNDYIAEYMSAADLYITKPGAQTTGEAMAKKLPMIFIHAIPGYETRNFDFLIRQGVATGAKNWKEVTHLACQALAKPEIPQAQVEAMERFVVPNAADVICKHIMKGL